MHDARTRMLFARKVKRIPSRDVWTNDVGIYFDGISWTHKTNPFDQARSTTAVAWRKKSEGLTLKCTTKGKKGSGSKLVKVLVVLSMAMGQRCVNSMKSRLQDKYLKSLSENVLKMLLKIVATHEGNYSCRMETLDSEFLESKECYVWHCYSNVPNSTYNHFHISRLHDVLWNFLFPQTWNVARLYYL